MPTKITDSATAQKAALNLNTGADPAKSAEPTAPKEKTTSEKMFPDFVTEDGLIVNRPVGKQAPKPSDPSPATATAQTPAPGQTPAVPAPTAPVYLNPDELTGKMVKLKVDGIEQDVPADTLIKTTQLERHLNAQLMKLAQERSQLEQERAAILARPPEPKPDAKPGKSDPDEKKTPEVQALEARLLQMQSEMAMLQQTMLPAIQESGIKRVEQMAKERLGTDDFRTYFDRIKDSAMAELAKPENAKNPQARAYFDSDQYYFQKYQELKLRDLVAKPAPAAPANPSAPVLQKPEGAPVVINNNGQPVSIPTFESSGGVPSRVSPDASWQGTYDSLLQRAKASGSQDDWMALYRHKVTARE